MAIRVSRSPSMVDYGKALYNAARMDEEYSRLAALYPQLAALGQQESQFRRTLALQQKQQSEALKEAKAQRALEQYQFQQSRIPWYSGGGGYGAGGYG